MAVRPEVVVLVLLAALLVGVAQGEDLQTMRVVFDGDHEATVADDALVVAGGSVAVPEGARTNGSLYVVGGTVRVDGTVARDVVLLQGNLSLGHDATVGGDLRAIGGDPTIADGATIRGVREVGTVPVDATPGDGGVLPTLLQAAVLAAAGFFLGRRSPALLRNVGEAITDHPLVSGTVGGLVAVVGVALLVVMAFTIVLIPVSVIGVVLGFLVVGYATVVYGFLVGRAVRRRFGGSGDAGVTTALGAAGFALLLWLLGSVPVVGSLLSAGLVLTGLGAVLVTYFGYRRFEPAP